MTRVAVDGSVVVLELDEVERGILSSLGGELAGMLREPDVADPVLRRLLPDAYPDDPEASAEFRRYTADGLARGKSGNAEALAADAAEARIELDAAAGDRWLRTLTDLRLALAERLGIRTDDDPLPDDAQGAVYAWLGELQWQLIDALDELPRPGREVDDAAGAR